MKVQKLTAETLLSAPRRSPAVPNRNGTLALFTVSTHMFGKGTANEVRVMDIKTGSSQQLSTDEKVHDALWIPGTDDQVIYLRSGDGGNTQVFVASAKDTERKHDMVAELKAPVAHLKLKLFKDGSVVFVVTGLVGENGELYNEEVVARKSTARVFDTPNVRMVRPPFQSPPGQCLMLSSGTSFIKLNLTPCGTRHSFTRMISGHSQALFTTFSKILDSSLQECTRSQIPSKTLTSVKMASLSSLESLKIATLGPAHSPSPSSAP